MTVDAAGGRSIFGGDQDEAADGGDDDEEVGGLPQPPQTSNSSTTDGAASGSGMAADASKVFYVEKGNGWRLVTAALEQYGWRRLPFEYGFRNDFGLKWVQTRAQHDYVAHKAGQLVNHIPNNGVITSKKGLLDTLKHHFGDSFPPAWYPESFDLDNAADGLKVCPCVWGEGLCCAWVERGSITIHVMLSPP